MYHIYFNWQARGEQLKVHYSQCAFCNNGQGRDIENIEPGLNGVWIGTFSKIEYVNHFIQRMGIEVSICNICNPE